MILEEEITRKIYSPTTVQQKSYSTIIASRSVAN